MLGSSELVAFVATTDLDRARAFYGGVLGLPVVEESPFACVFDAHGTQLRVTPVAEIRTAPYTVLGWAVDDIVAAVRALGARGCALRAVRRDGAGRPRGVDGPERGRVAWFADPDGNVLSLTQAPRLSGEAS